MKYQVMPDLGDAEYQALKSDIAENGVLVPIELDENGDILDGHHRLRAWEELRSEGIDLADYPRIIRSNLTEEQKRNHARSLNVLRRHLSREQRDDVMRQMRADGATIQKIADSVGVSVGTVHSAVAGVELFNSEKLQGADGKYRPASYERKVDATIPAWKTPSHVSIEDKYGHAETILTTNARTQYRLQAANHAVSDDPNYDGDEWYTPSDIIDLARIVLGSIDLDPASSDNANAIVRAASYYTKDDDGLTMPWYGRVWLNPPYSIPLINRFTDRVLSEYGSGKISAAIVLTNNSSETKWFQSLFSASVVCFPARRLPFWRDNQTTFGARQGQAIFYLGKDRQSFVTTFDHVGIIAESI